MRTIPRLRHTVDECNPFGMDQRRSARCVLDKPIIFPDLNPTLEEYGSSSGFYLEGSSSVVTTGYKAKTYPSSSYLLYNWTVIGATIVAGGSGHNFVEVETRSNTNNTFTVQLVVRNAEQEDNVSQNFSHTRIERPYDIALLDIVEDVAGSCTWDTSMECEASSTYSATYANNSGTLNYVWTCQGAGIVDNLDGTATVTTKSNEDDTFNVSLVLTDDYSSDSRSEEFTHNRTENVIAPVVVTDITEDAAGSCEWNVESTCDAISTHTIVHTHGVTFEWSSPSATILTGQGTETVTVETTNSVDISFDLQCIVRNSISSDKRIETFTHTRAEIPIPLPVISDIIESGNLGCEYDGVSAEYFNMVLTTNGLTPVVDTNGTTTVTEDSPGVFTVSSDDPITYAKIVGNADDITSVVVNKGDTITSASYMFSGCEKCISYDFLNWNSVNLTIANNMFYRAHINADFDLANLDTSNVTTMHSMFSNPRGATQDVYHLDLTGLDTSSVIDFGYMFASCTSLFTIDVSGFNTSSAVLFTGMFNSVYRLRALDVSNFDFSSVTDTSYMFKTGGGLDGYGYMESPIVFSPTIDTSKVQNMEWMFGFYTGSELDLSNFNTSSVTNMQSMFSSTELWNLDISNFDVSSVNTFRYMFLGSRLLGHIKMDGWNIATPAYMRSMFGQTSKLQSISYIDTRLSLGTLDMFDDALKHPTVAEQNTLLSGAEWINPYVTGHLIGTIEVTGLGSCTYDTGLGETSCEATTTHTVVPRSDSVVSDTYLWTTIGNTYLIGSDNQISAIFASTSNIRKDIYGSCAVISSSIGISTNMSTVTEHFHVPV